MVCSFGISLKILPTKYGGYRLLYEALHCSWQSRCCLFSCFKTASYRCVES